MNSLNKVQLIGNTTANPEVRETPNGQKVATFSVATSRAWKDAAGEKQEQTEFHNVVLWRGLADIAERYVTKGQKVYVEGYLQTRSWEAADGSKRYRTEIVADNLIMLSSKPSGSKTDDDYSQPFGADDDDQEPKPAKKQSAKKARKDDEIHIEDIPF